MEIGLITGNMGKVTEIASFMKEEDIYLYHEREPFIEIQADTLEEVILTGMEEFTERRGKDAFLMKDDSGLFIDDLSGFPGVYSAYVQKTIGNEGILKLMEGRTRRSARFKTVIGLYVPGRGTSLFRGEVTGEITSVERGNNGFGFDPLFRPEGMEITFAQMETDQKNSISHRIRALRKMVEHLHVHVR